MPAPLAPSAAPPFEYIGGDPALDFVNTADWTDVGPVEERLRGYEDLVRWGVGADVVPQSVAERLRRRALARPREAGAALAAAVRARGVLREVLTSAAAGDQAGPALGDLNRLISAALARLEVTAARTAGDRPRAHWRWRGMDERLDSVLWPVVRSAAHLLTSDEAGQIRVCAGSGCGWMYVDRSRNGLRRWCQMRTCGTREKTRRRRGVVT